MKTTDQTMAQHARKVREHASKSKYGNKWCKYDGINFQSKAEARRYGQLKLLLTAGQIGSLKMQARYPLEVSGELICTYVADFRYMDHQTGKPVVEDVKGHRTDVYKLKKKLMKAIYGIDIVEIKA